MRDSPLTRIVRSGTRMALLVSSMGSFQVPDRSGAELDKAAIETRAPSETDPSSKSSPSLPKHTGGLCVRGVTLPYFNRSRTNELGTNSGG